MPSFGEVCFTVKENRYAPSEPQFPCIKSRWKHSAVGLRQSPEGPGGAAGFWLGSATLRPCGPVALVRRHESFVRWELMMVPASRAP